MGSWRLQCGLNRIIPNLYFAVDIAQCSRTYLSIKLSLRAVCIHAMEGFTNTGTTSMLLG